MIPSNAIGNEADLLSAARREATHGNSATAVRLYRQLLDATDDQRLRAEALRRIGDVFRQLEDWDAALAAIRESREIAEKHELLDGVEDAILAEANCYFARGEFERAAPLYEEVLRLGQSVLHTASAELNLASIAAQQRRFDEADALFERSQRHYEEAGWIKGRILALNNQGCCRLDAARLTEAIEILDRARELAWRDHEKYLYGLATANRGEAYLKLGQYAHAVRDLGEAPYYLRARTQRRNRMITFGLMGDAVSALGDHAQARSWYHKALALAIELNLPEQQADYRARFEGAR